MVHPDEEAWGGESTLPVGGLEVWTVRKDPQVRKDGISSELS